MKSQHRPVVLMYHGVVQSSSVLPEDRKEGAELYDVALDAFEQQMQWLAANDVQVGTLSGELSSKRIVLTFDDGERNNIEFACPVLWRFGFPAYFFVTVQRIGNKGYLNWEELRELRDRGMIIGSHGLNHRILTGLTRHDLAQELEESKAILEKELKLSICDFSVPRGFYDGQVLKAARKAGYKRIFVSETISSADFVIERRAVRAQWTLDRFALTVQGQTPSTECVINACKGSAKKILGVQKYDKVRTFLLSLRKNTGVNP